jgi:hypothetical protein
MGLRLVDACVYVGKLERTLEGQQVSAIIGTYYMNRYTDTHDSTRPLALHHPTMAHGGLTCVCCMCLSL